MVTHNFNPNRNLIQVSLALPHAAPGVVGHPALVDNSVDHAAGIDNIVRFSIVANLVQGPLRWTLGGVQNDVAGGFAGRTLAIPRTVAVLDRQRSGGSRRNHQQAQAPSQPKGAAP